MPLPAQRPATNEIPTLPATWREPPPRTLRLASVLVDVASPNFDHAVADRCDLQMLREEIEHHVAPKSEAAIGLLATLAALEGCLFIRGGTDDEVTHWRAHPEAQTLQSRIAVELDRLELLLDTCYFPARIRNLDEHPKRGIP